MGQPGMGGPPGMAPGMRAPPGAPGGGWDPQMGGAGPGVVPGGMQPGMPQPGMAPGGDGFGGFWISWKDATLRVGRGHTVGSDEIMHLDMSGHIQPPLRHMLVSTGFGATGRWRVWLERKEEEEIGKGAGEYAGELVDWSYHKYMGLSKPPLVMCAWRVRFRS